MATGLRSQLALVALIGLFLIPLVTSSLNGLTHVITCSGDSRTPFVVNVGADGRPTMTSAESFDRSAPLGVCGGLVLSIGVAQQHPGAIRVLVPITNHSRYRWQGTVRLLLGGTSVPVRVGTIPPGATRTSHVDVAIGSGATNISGSLLIGP